VLFKRIRDEGKNSPPVSKPVYADENDYLPLQIKDFALSLGWDASLVRLWSRRLVAGGKLVINGRHYFTRNDGNIYYRNEQKKVPINNLLRKWINSRKH
jgi:hypothetical protein